MNTKDVFTRRNILDVAAEMIKESGSESFRIVEAAERANVDVATIHQYFDSRSQLIAEAQMANYFSMVEPLHLVLSRVESAVAEEDQVAFWAALEENMLMAWSSG